MPEWLQQIPQQGQLFAQAVVELLVVTVAMPWRITLALLIIIFLVYLLFWRFLPWALRFLLTALFGVVELIISLLLLPEYLVTRQLRSVGWGPLWGSYLYGDLLGGVVRLFHAPVDGLDRWQRWRFPWFVLILLAALPVGLWYLRPFVEGMEAARYMDTGFRWWYQLEMWLLQRTV